MYTVLGHILPLVALPLAALISFFQIDFAHAQAIPQSIQQGGSEWVIRERKNAWTVGIDGGLIDGTYMRFADELASAPRRSYARPRMATRSSSSIRQMRSVLRCTK